MPKWCRSITLKRAGTIGTFAHEVGHNFGSLHDGENSTAYIRCDNRTKNNGLMGGNIIEIL